MDDPLNDPDCQQQILTAVEQAGRVCGLYLERASFAQAGLEGEQPRPVLVVALRVGDLAFTKRVLNPAADQDDRVIREREVDAQRDEVAEIRRRLLNKEGSLGALEADDD